MSHLPADAHRRLEVSDCGLTECRGKPRCSKCIAMFGPGVERLYPHQLSLWGATSHEDAATEIGRLHGAAPAAAAESARAPYAFAALAPEMREVAARLRGKTWAWHRNYAEPEPPGHTRSQDPQDAAALLDMAANSLEAGPAQFPNQRALVRSERINQSILHLAMQHPRVLEIMADCAVAIDTETAAQYDPDAFGGQPYDGTAWEAKAAELRARASAIRAEDPELWLETEPARPVAQICGACGKPWDGQRCAQAENGWPREVFFPVDAAAQQELTQADHVAQALAEAHTAPPLKWPAGRDVGRAEDMGQGYLRVVLDSDNDVCVAVWDGQRSASVEFCNGLGGGGRSMHTRMALIALMVAMEADNAESPSLQRPERARAAGAQGGK